MERSFPRARNTGALEKLDPQEASGTHNSHHTVFFPSKDIFWLAIKYTRITDNQFCMKEKKLKAYYESCFSRHETAKRLHAKRFSYTFLFSIVILVTILKSVSPMCQISLMQFTASSTLSGPGPQAIGSPLSTQMYILAQSLPHPAVLCLFRQAAR